MKNILALFVIFVLMSSVTIVPFSFNPVLAETHIDGNWSGTFHWSFAGYCDWKGDVKISIIQSGDKFSGSYSQSNIKTQSFAGDGCILDGTSGPISGTISGDSIRLQLSSVTFTGPVSCTGMNISSSIGSMSLKKRCSVGSSGLSGPSGFDFAISPERRGLDVRQTDTGVLTILVKKLVKMI